MRRIIAVCLMMLGGAGVLAYPSLSNYLSERNGSQVVDSYASEVGDADDARLAGIWQQAEEYNQSLTGSPVHDPFLEGSGVAMPADYAQTLSLSGVMAHVEIPKIGVDLPVYHGTSEAVLQRGVGHLEGSTLPIGGQERHAVLTGHTGLPNAKLFTDLTELVVGDLIYIHVLDQVLAYQVDQILVVEPHQTEALKSLPGRDLLTLLTCTPYGINSQRLLVRGERVDYSPEAYQAIDQVTSRADLAVLWAGLVTAAVMALVILVVWWRTRGRQRRARRAVPSGGGTSP